MTATTVPVTSLHAQLELEPIVMAAANNGNAIFFMFMILSLMLSRFRTHSRSNGSREHVHSIVQGVRVTRICE